MATLEEVKKTIFKKLKPIKAKIADFQTNLNELENSYQFLSLKYDKVVSQTQSESGKQRKFESRLDDFKKDFIRAEEALEDIALYLRRDCVEISGAKTSEDLTCKEIVTSLGQEIGMEINDCDISTAHPLPTFGDKKDDKIIVKFTRRETRYEFYGRRKTVAGRIVSSLENFKDHNLVAGQKVFIAQSLTPFRKKLFGAVNRIKKKP